MHLFRYCSVDIMLRVALQPHVCNSPVASHASPGGRPLEFVPILDLPILPYRLAACRAESFISDQVNHTTVSHDWADQVSNFHKDQASKTLLMMADL